MIRMLTRISDTSEICIGIAPKVSCDKGLVTILSCYWKGMEPLGSWLSLREKLNCCRYSLERAIYTWATTKWEGLTLKHFLP